VDHHGDDEAQAVIDVLTYCTMPDTLRMSYGWEGEAFDVVAPGKWTRIKNAKGYPWDIRLFDDSYVYDWITEVNYSNPRDYKKFVLNHLDANGRLADGVPMFPRFLPDGFTHSEILTPKSRSVYRMFLDCKWDQQATDIGDVRHTLSGPFLISHGGDVGTQPTLVHEYFWNGKSGLYMVVETNLYALNFGWVRWSVANLIGGVYVIQNVSVHSKLVKMTVPKVVFDCF
jgi:hypothetical protein